MLILLVPYSYSKDFQVQLKVSPAVRGGNIPKGSVSVPIFVVL